MKKLIGLKHKTDKYRHGFIPLYDMIFAPYQGKKNLNVLEVGIKKGESIRMWREYFGDTATIYAIDSDPACTLRVEGEAQALSGNAYDSVVAKSLKPLDIAIDDGSHRYGDQIGFLNLYLPKMKPGGVLVVEDLHTSDRCGSDKNPMYAIYHFMLYGHLPPKIERVTDTALMALYPVLCRYVDRIALYGKQGSLMGVFFCRTEEKNRAPSFFWVKE